MPSVIRKSDGKVFDVFGSLITPTGHRFLIFQDDHWVAVPAEDFEPAPSLHQNIVVTVDPPKELPPDLGGMGANNPHHDPDLEAQ